MIYYRLWKYTKIVFFNFSSKKKNIFFNKNVYLKYKNLLYYHQFSSYTNNSLNNINKTTNVILQYKKKKLVFISPNEFSLENLLIQAKKYFQITEFENIILKNEKEEELSLKLSVNQLNKNKNNENLIIKLIKKKEEEKGSFIFIFFFF